MQRSFESTRLLFVKGDDDKAFYNGLKSGLELSNSDIEVIPYNGKDKLRSWLKAHSELSAFERVNALAVVRDADISPDNSHASVRGALGTIFDPAPSAHMEFQESTLRSESPLQGQKISSTILILPGRSRQGELQDLLLDAIDDEATMACVNEYMKCLESKNIPIQKPAKTRLQSYLATREKADAGL